MRCACDEYVNNLKSLFFLLLCFCLLHDILCAHIHVNILTTHVIPPQVCVITDDDPAGWKRL